MKISVTRPPDLHRITDLIHDTWFSVSEVQYDAVARSLRIPFGTRRATEVTWLLEVHNVSDWRIEESEFIERYDFNEFEYSAESGRLTFRTGIDLTFHVDVAALQLTASNENVE